MALSYLGVLSMARCSNTTSVDLQFPVSISIVHTIAVFYFQEKRENVPKKKRRGKRGSDMLKTWTSDVQKLGSNELKTWAKESKQLVLTCPKSGPAKKKEESALTCPKPELRWRKRSDSNMLKTWVTKRRRILQVSDLKPSQFCFQFSANFVHEQLSLCLGPTASQTV